MAGGLWLAGVVIGFWMLLSYQSRPGTSAAPPSELPRDLGFGPSTGKDTLIVFLHPKCPCSHATVGELHRIVARCREQLDVAACFVGSSSTGDEWTEGSLWNEVGEIPGVARVIDRDGRIARRFHVRTSGQVVLYGWDGRLRFSGGITASRGHAGDNVGEAAVIDLVLGQRSAREEAPVFGCELSSAPPASEL